MSPDDAAAPRAPSKTLGADAAHGSASSASEEGPLSKDGQGDAVPRTSSKTLTADAASSLAPAAPAEDELPKVPDPAHPKEPESNGTPQTQLDKDKNRSNHVKQEDKPARQQPPLVVSFSMKVTNVKYGVVHSEGTLTQDIERCIVDAILDEIGGGLERKHIEALLAEDLMSADVRVHATEDISVEALRSKLSTSTHLAEQVAANMKRIQGLEACSKGSEISVAIATEFAVHGLGQQQAPQVLDNFMLHVVKKRLRHRAATAESDAYGRPVVSRCQSPLEEFFLRCDIDQSGTWNLFELRDALRGPLKIDRSVLPDWLLPALFKLIDTSRNGQICLDDLDRFALKKQIRNTSEAVREDDGPDQEDAAEKDMRTTPYALSKASVLALKRQYHTEGEAFMKLAEFVRPGPIIRKNTWTRILEGELHVENAGHLYEVMVPPQEVAGITPDVFRVLWRLVDDGSSLQLTTVEPTLLQLFADLLRARFPDARSAFQALACGEDQPLSKDQFGDAMLREFSKSDAAGAGPICSQRAEIFEHLDPKNGEGSFSLEVLSLLWKLSSMQKFFGPDDDLYGLAKPILEGCAKGDVRKKALSKLREFLANVRSDSLHEIDCWSGPGSPLEGAIKANCVDVVRLLLQRGASPHVTSRGEVSTLHLAAFMGNPDIVSLLCHAKSNANIMDKHGQTPIFFAASAAVCEALAIGGADVDVINQHGQSCLHLAAKAGLLDTLHWMARRCDASLMQLKDRYGASAAYYATSAGISKQILKTMKLLIPAAPLPPRRGRLGLSFKNDQKDPYPTCGLEHGANKKSKKRSSLPPWLVRRLVSESKENVSRSTVGDHRALKHMFPQQLVDHLRRKILAACYVHGDGSVYSLEILLNKYDVDESGHLSIEEVHHLLRKGLKISKIVIPDDNIEDLFRMLDQDGSGAIEIDELVSFVDPVHGAKQKFLRRLQAKFRKHGVQHVWLGSVREHIKAETHSWENMNSGIELDTLLRRLDVKESGTFTLDLTLDTMEALFDLPRGCKHLSPSNFKKIFSSLVSPSSGEIDIDEIMDVIDFNRECRMQPKTFEKKIGTRRNPGSQKSSGNDMASVDDDHDDRSTQPSLSPAAVYSEAADGGFAPGVSATSASDVGGGDDQEAGRNAEVWHRERANLGTERNCERWQRPRQRDNSGHQLPPDFSGRQPRPSTAHRASGIRQAQSNAQQLSASTRPQTQDGSATRPLKQLATQSPGDKLNPRRTASGSRKSVQQDRARLG